MVISRASYLKVLLYLLFLTQGIPLFCAQSDPEIIQSAYEIIEGKGYQANQYIVETEDGYYITLHRIRAKLNATQNNMKFKRVALLQHGLMDSAHAWINNLANESLGFILADAGFDVWLGNSRGSTYSQRHARLDPSKSAFWEFSWDEMSKYDLPAVIGFILNETEVNKIYYVGHSQGAQIALARFNVDQALRERVVAFVALAPVAYLGDVHSPIRYMSSFCKSLRNAEILFGGRGRFRPYNWLVRFLDLLLCRRSVGSFPSSVCKNVMFLISGFDPRNTNVTRIPVYIAHSPAGTSVQNIVHYCQGMWRDQFVAFDFGSASANLAKYNRTTPPPYGLTASAINLPTRVYWGGKDWLATPYDVQRILREMTADPRVDDVSDVYLEDYNHLDFVLGVDAPRRVYTDIINFFERFQ
ncbi:hypothetical protein Aperf_G00000130057 [Anoplocephala perfoliata]